MKNILFILATHGDESFSLPVFKKIEKKYPKEVYGYDYIIGNEKAIKKNVRFVDCDLNRSAPGNPKSKLYEERRAFELGKIIDEYKYVVDVHGTISNTGIFNIIPNPSLKNIIFSTFFPIKRAVIWYEEGKKGPVTQFCKAVSCEIECGPKEDPKIALKLEEIIGMLLKNIVNEKLDFTVVSKKQFFSVYESQKEKKRGMEEFRKTKVKGESFYPLMLGQYEGIACYKMKKIKFENLFLKI